MALTSGKKALFWAITILFPFFLLALVELGLRIGGYSEESQDLFIEMPGNPDYWATNPSFSGRYFPNFVPQVAPAPFLKEKPDSTFRVFVFGGSSTQGFPFSFYGSFSSRIEQKLMMETLGLNIEVINLGMTAVNSYIIWDLSKRVLDYEPDAVVIYAGHNEYYGSFGVGSSQFGVGKQIWLKRLIINLKNLRLYQLIENQFKVEDDNPEHRTMMARVVSQSSIPLDGEIYKAGIKQFQKNIGDAVDTFLDESIPVYIGTVTSNLKDQAPLGENVEAQEMFDQAQVTLQSGDTALALQQFLESKELDDTRFRAPEEINTVITAIGEKEGITLVDILGTSVDSSLSGIPDNSFFVDHLHPDWNANQLIGELFFDKIIERQLADFYLPNKLSKRPLINQFEKTYSETPIYRLLSGYPFTKGLSPSEEQARFQAQLNRYYKKSYVDSVAASAWGVQRQAHLALVDIINYKKARNDKRGISEHYLSLAQWQIFNNDLLKKGINEVVNSRELDSNTALLLHLILSKQKRSDPYFANSLSAIYLINEDLDRAGYWLKKSEKINPDSRELLYNYARYFVLKGDTTKARNYFERFSELSRQP